MKNMRNIGIVALAPWFAYSGRMGTTAIENRWCFDALLGPDAKKFLPSLTTTVSEPPVGKKEAVGIRAMKYLGRAVLLAFVLIFMALAQSKDAKAAEGASSHYIPGLAGDIAIAISPSPGWMLSNSMFYQTGDIGTAVLQGRVNLGLDLDLFLNLVGASYTFKLPALRCTYTLSTAIPFGYANLEAQLTGRYGTTFNVDEDSFNLSDIIVIPFQMNWKIGNFHLKLAEGIIAPTGGYDIDNNVNLGRNYWSFDTIAALTWLYEETGTEFSVQPGIMFNTENDDTDYKTGTEFHMDFAVNQFLTKTFALGLRGYYYQQLTGDSGSGAVLGDFKSESVGLGPGFVWMPAFAEGKLTILGKWMHDIEAENRFESDYFTFAIAWKF